METQIEQVQLMSRTLESSGFSPQQSNAVIKSVALAMQTFAVTPEVLDQVLDRRLGQLKTELKAEILAEVPSRADFNEQGDDIKEQGRDIKDLNKSMNRAFEKRDDDIKDLNKSMDRAFEKRDEDIKDLKKSTFNYQMGFSLVILAAILGSHFA